MFSIPCSAAPDDVGLQREAVPVAADELHHRLHPELAERDRDRERRGVRVGSRVVGRVDRVDVLLERLEALVTASRPPASTSCSSA